MCKGLMKLDICELFAMGSNVESDMLKPEKLGCVKVVESTSHTGWGMTLEWFGSREGGCI